MRDQRLLGTWRSDRRRTARDINARSDIPKNKRAQLIAIFGHLSLRYTSTRCYSSFRGHTESCAYKVVAKNADGVLVVRPGDSLTGDDSLQHVRFEGRHYWVSLGAFREYFRRIVARPSQLQRTRPAQAMEARRRSVRSPDRKRSKSAGG